jgi:cyclopropane fatty-acyl-phospholipid synthase-like methyltransferase
VSDQILGGSSKQCDWVTKEQIKTLNPKSVVDFGSGRGKYCRFVRELLGSDVLITAVDGYKPAADNLEKSGLCNHVDHVLLQRWFDGNKEKYDLAIFGDVLEHLPPRKIKSVLRKSFEVFKWIIIVLPLYDIFQRDSYGNKLEDHVAYIGPDFFDKFHPLEKHIVSKARDGTPYDIMNILLSSEYKDTRKPVKKILRQVRHYLILTLQHIGLAKAFVDFENFIRG